jgi:hypothetical protein
MAVELATSYLFTNKFLRKNLGRVEILNTGQDSSLAIMGHNYLVSDLCITLKTVHSNCMAHLE